MKQPAAKVASRPAKPLMIYDGDCNFCRFWILRWERATAGRVEFIASQDARVAAQFPELSRERLDESVQLIEPDGTVSSGAEAVFRALAQTPFCSWLPSCYASLPGLAPVTEWAYALVARHRSVFSALTRILWGRDGVLPEFKLSSWVFLRLLGLIYLIAFVSLGSQIMGLVGAHGILPAAQLMDSARTQLDQRGIGVERYHILPTLCWFSASDGFLKFQCVAGAVLAVLVIANIAPAPCLFLLWLIYLSLSCVCREFLSFQWDVLLLETGFLAIFLAPLQLWPRRSSALPPSRIARWLLWWLLFRLMFESGMVKLLSHDPTWHNLTALNYHYETQPLPTWIGWYAHQLPEGIQKACVLIMFILELGVPFLIFAPRHLRFFAAGSLFLLQVIIFLTGNYCFFNLLAIALCLLLLDDAAIARFVPRPLRFRKIECEEPDTLKRELQTANGLRSDPTCAKSSPAVDENNSRVNKTPESTDEFPKKFGAPNSRRARWPIWITAPLAIVILMVTASQILGMLRVIDTFPTPIGMVHEWIYPFRSVNTYGLFAVMTTSRPEIVIEGSNDGATWLAYEFKYKPGDLKQRPRFVAPHQPRLDWQMWFAALGDARQNAWLANCCVRILQGSPDVLALLGRNPFPGAPPRYVRAVVYEYHFTNFKERHADGAWWRRELKGEYLPPMSLPPAAERQP